MRFTALCPFVPSNSAFAVQPTIQSSAPTSVYPATMFQTGFGLQELAFWFQRVSQWAIVGTYTQVSGGVTWTGGFSHTSNVQVGSYLVTQADPTDEADLYKNGQFIEDSFTFNITGTDSSVLTIGVTLEMSAQTIVHNPAVGPGGATWFPVINLVIGGANSLATTGNSYGLTMAGTDLYLGNSYSRVIPMFSPVGPPTVSGSATISPAFFFGYSDGSTNFYDTTTGAKL